MLSIWWLVAVAVAAQLVVAAAAAGSAWVLEPSQAGVILRLSETEAAAVQETLLAETGRLRRSMDLSPQAAAVAGDTALGMTVAAAEAVAVAVRLGLLRYRKAAAGTRQPLPHPKEATAVLAGLTQ